MKHRLIRPPILHMPNCEGRFHLYLDMSKFTTGSTLYQIQNGKPKLIAYLSKGLPGAAFWPFLGISLALDTFGGEATCSLTDVVAVSSANRACFVAF